MCERYMDWLPLICPQQGPWPATQAHALTGNQTCFLFVHRPAFNPLSHSSQGCLNLQSLDCNLYKEQQKQNKQTKNTKGNK